MWKIYGTVSIYLCFVLCMGHMGMAQDGLESMKLLSPDVGWAATEHRIFWTSDAGQRWKDITPPAAASGKIAAIFFLDTSTGWTLISRQAEPEPQFNIAFTDNSGESWSTNRIVIPNLNPERTVLGGDGFVDFVDPVHGWMNLSVVGSSNFNLGALLATDNGGKTWNWVPQSPSIAGAVQFISIRDGWIAGGPGNGELYGTHDGSRSWAKVVIERPSQIDKNASAVYDSPSFENNLRGALSVTYEGAEGADAAVAVFNTGDGGKTWTLSDVLSNLPADHHGVPYPSAMIDSSLAIVTGSDKTLTLIKSAGGQRRVVTGTLVKPQTVHVSRLSLASDTAGWVLTSRGLLSTRDSGITWISITPPQLKESYEMLPGGGTPAALSTSQPHWTHLSSAIGNAALGNPVSIHVGFDQCAAATVAQMQSWWNHSPYYDTGIYIGGASRTCAQPNLTSSWVTQVRTQGWGLIPLWPGPQAPCACQPGGTGCTPFPHVFSSTPSTAQSQGIAEADSAASAASALGLPAEIVYYDLENYPSTCKSAATAFINGWVSELHTKMPQAGVYGNSTDASRDWAGVPDAVFIAQYSGKVTVYGLNPLTDTGSWSVNQRIHQYTGGHNETWGGLVFNIDSDMEDAIVDVCSPECPGEQGLKNFTYSFQTISDPGFNYTAPTAINNNGAVVGFTNNPSGGNQGFQYKAGAFTAITVSGSVNVYATGINNPGLIVGACGGTSCNGTPCCGAGYYGGFIDNAGTFTFIDYPNIQGNFLYSIADDGLILGICNCGPINDGTADNSFFLYENGQYTNLSLGYAFGGAVNGAHQVAGSIENLNCSHDQPFLYNDNDGSSILLDCSTFSDPLGITNNDIILMTDVSDSYYSLYDYANGTFIHLPLYYPGTTSFLNYTGINDKGKLVGDYLNSSNVDVGFIATPQ